MIRAPSLSSAQSVLLPALAALLAIQSDAPPLTGTGTRTQSLAARALLHPSRADERKTHCQLAPQRFARVSSSIQGTIPADEWKSATITVIPTLECQKLTTIVRGMRGIQVEGGSELESSCGLEQESSRQVLVRAPAGADGFIAIDYQLETPSGPRGFTRILELRAKGAPPRAAKPIGRVSYDSTGIPVVILRAERR